jgi:hypothetical protein
VVDNREHWNTLGENVKYVPVPVPDGEKDTGEMFMQENPDYDSRPADRRLHREMQAVEPKPKRNLDPAQDHRCEMVERDLKTGYGVGIHKASLRRSSFAAQ